MIGCSRLSHSGHGKNETTIEISSSISFVVITLFMVTLLIFSASLAAGATTQSHDLASDTSGISSTQQILGTNLSQQNGSNAATTISFDNQTTNGSTVTVDSVTLSEPGYIALHTSGYATGPAPAEYSIIAVSSRLSAGHHENVTINVSNAPPENPPGLNLTQLNTSQTLAVTVHQDTNGNQRFDFVQSTGSDDGPFVVSGDVVSDIARARVPTSSSQTVSVTFRNQTLRNNTLTVAQAHLPRGGFLIAHNASFQRTGDAVTSAVGLSRYLPPGNYTTITLRILPNTLDETQIVTIRPSLDTNGNQQYDYVTSNGFQDVAYEHNSEVVTAPAVVRVPSSQQATHTPAATQQPTMNPQLGTSTKDQTNLSIQTDVTTPTASSSSSPQDSKEGNKGTGSENLLDRLGIEGLIVILLAIAVVVLLIIWRSR